MSATNPTSDADYILRNKQERPSIQRSMTLPLPHKGLLDEVHIQRLRLVAEKIREGRNVHLYWTKQGERRKFCWSIDKGKTDMTIFVLLGQAELFDWMCEEAQLRLKGMMR